MPRLHQLEAVKTSCVLQPFNFLTFYLVTLQDLVWKHCALKTKADLIANY